MSAAISKNMNETIKQIKPSIALFCVVKHARIDYLKYRPPVGSVINDTTMIIKEYWNLEKDMHLHFKDLCT